MKVKLLLCFLSLFSSLALAQTTASINGTVVDDAGEGLPGVTVLIESSKMIGTRTDVSRANGAFLFRRIPPGDYTITATMSGMGTEKTTIRLGLGTIARPEIVMKPEASSQELTVTASLDPVLDNVEVATQFDSDFINKLATGGRGQQEVARLAPGVTFNDGTGAASVSGANNGANTWLVNGADSRFDAIRSQPIGAVIEDSIQETTILTAAISAEYGQFGGGVINTITKSGGNEFHGSARLAFSNQDWVARTPNELASTSFAKVDDVDNIQTVTFGGPILKDRLWFFIAGEQTETNIASNFVEANPLTDRAAIAYGLPPGQTAPGARQIPGRVDEDERIDFKLTGRIAEGHDLTISYLKRETTQVNRPQAPLDITATATRTIPREQRSITYNGSITPSFSVELQWSDRESVFNARQNPPHIQEQLDAGADIRVIGTAIRYNRTPRGFINSPQFLGKPDEPRSNETFRAQASYFLITDNLGSHDFTFGVQQTEDNRFADNRQYVNDWTFWNSFRFEGEQPIPIFSPTAADGRYQTRLIYYPIEIPSGQTEFKADSIFINDTWTLNDKWRFNVGFRYDANEGRRQDGVLSADDDIIAPRLSLNYDLHGDGKHEFNASYSVYAQRIGWAANDGNQAGSPSFTQLRYRGPQTENFLEVIDWINQTYGEGFFLDPLNHPNRAAWEADLSTNQLTNGVLDSPGQLFGRIDENGNFVEEGLKTPNTEEFRFGYTHRFGNKGFMKFDYVHRDFKDFYVDNTNLLTGPTNNGRDDLNVISNNDELYEKKYDAIQSSFRWRFNKDFSVSGNYTWSQLIGNTNGGSTSGILTTVGALTVFPEYNNFPNRLPSGYLRGDQRHIANIFAVYTLETSFGTFDFSASERIASGSPFDRSITLDLDEGRTYGLPPQGSVGYVDPPDTTTYFISRGQDRADTLYETNLGVNFSLPIGKIDLFVEIDFLNIFNSDTGNIGWAYNTTVDDLQVDFDVFNETPIEGTHYQLDDEFGTPNSTFDFQRPRAFTIDVGVRF